MSVSIGGGGAAAAGLTAQNLLPPAYNNTVAEFKALQAALQALVQKQTTFEGQRTENMVVKNDLDGLKAGETVYKLMGKVLARQDPADAKTTVAGRLEFLEKELTRVEGDIKATQEKMLAARRRLMEMQQAAQQQQPPQRR